MLQVVPAADHVVHSLCATLHQQANPFRYLSILTTITVASRYQQLKSPVDSQKLLVVVVASWWVEQKKFETGRKTHGFDHVAHSTIC